MWTNWCSIIQWFDCGPKLMKCMEFKKSWTTYCILFMLKKMTQVLNRSGYIVCTIYLLHNGTKNPEPNGVITKKSIHERFICFKIWVNLRTNTNHSNFGLILLGWFNYSPFHLWPKDCEVKIIKWKIKISSLQYLLFLDNQRTNSRNPSLNWVGLL